MIADKVSRIDHTDTAQTVLANEFKINLDIEKYYAGLKSCNFQTSKMLEINRDDSFPVIQRKLEFDQVAIVCADPAAAIQPIQEKNAFSVLM